MIFPCSGIEESIEITNQSLQTAIQLFSQHFDDSTHALYSWGSVARREMGPFSDLDLLIISQHPNIDQIKKYQESLTKALPNQRMDILEPV